MRLVHAGANSDSGCTQLSITDPLVMYQLQVDIGKLHPDEAQYRAAKEFQSLYYRVKDYVPPEDFLRNVKKLSDLLECSKLILLRAHTIVPEDGSTRWYNSAEKDSVSLIKILTDEEELFSIEAPQGLLVHGEVGCGKSMLMDMFANCLPHHSKRRWHNSNFMLWVYSRIHTGIQENRRLRHSGLFRGLQNEFVLLKIAHDLFDECKILMLDEFMLPDIASAKIVKTLLTYYFKMGGVLVATSNRLPEELYSAEFKKDHFVSFYNVLQTRCMSHDMRSNIDWREKLAEHKDDNSSFDKKYWVRGVDPDEEWEKTVEGLFGDIAEGRPQRLTVYGRTLTIPWTHKGAAIFDFETLCGEPLGSADYITIASNFHTVVIDNVPALTLTRKNEAKRLISLLDALYESRVKLLMRAEKNPDDLFFPDAKTPVTDLDNSLDQEMFSEVDMDLSSPFRPNVALYDKNAMPKAGNESAELPRQISRSAEDDSVKKDFTRVSAFTGEDERFAYKRAVSRIKEMTGSTAWWEDGIWMPIDISVRRWEETRTYTGSTATSEDANVYRSPFRSPQNEPPRFSYAHFWATIVWGAGRKHHPETQRWLLGVKAYEK
ncbi:AFG1-like ATPase-domain-containing protein [Dipodascopsis tothii]|uniref:AFG1-like ATPase-domain-containing protein n=1 Tax=Dipodascopsis tothii TaxID=44089 RepID=UPI0034CDD199